MTETLDLEKALEETVDEAQENIVTDATIVEDIDKSKEVDKDDEDKDPFEGLEENKDFFTLNNGDRVMKQDMIDGFMRQDDYTQKTMDLAESRQQLNLAKHTTKVDTTKENKTIIDLDEQNKSMDEALAEMDENDPMRTAFKVLVEQNNQLINFVNNQTKSNEQAQIDATTEENMESAKKLIQDSLDKESKNYTLPVIKGDGDEKTDTRELWNELVLADLQAINENLSLAQYNHRVNQVGKKAYKRLRSIISAASVGKPKDETGGDERGSSNTEIKPVKSSEDSTKSVNEIDKGLGLGQRLTNAMDRRDNNR